MATATDLTFDLVPPRRPSLADCGGATKEDDLAYPPDPTLHPTAAEWNLFAKLLAAYGEVLPVAVISVELPAGVPTIVQVQTLSSLLGPGDFTLTDNGIGDTTITWAADALPPPVNKPSASVNEDASTRIAAFNVTNGVRVKTWGATDTLADAAFTVEVR